MNGQERAARDELIERLFRQKTPQIVIAARVGLQVSRLHDILKARGLLRPTQPRFGVVTSTIWDMEDRNKIRRAIHRRQREGARAALAAMRQQQ